MTCELEPADRGGCIAGRTGSLERARDGPGDTVGQSPGDRTIDVVAAVVPRATVDLLDAGFDKLSGD